MHIVQQTNTWSLKQELQYCSASVLFLLYCPLTVVATYFPLWLITLYLFKWLHHIYVYKALYKNYWKYKLAVDLFLFLVLIWPFVLFQHALIKLFQTPQGSRTQRHVDGGHVYWFSWNEFTSSFLKSERRRERTECNHFQPNPSRKHTLSYHHTGLPFTVCTLLSRIRFAYCQSYPLIFFTLLPLPSSTSCI